MRHSRISPDDPKLTAYALGELPIDERADVEAALADDPEARAAVEAIRAFGGALEAALANESDAARDGAPLAESVEPWIGGSEGRKKAGSEEQTDHRIPQERSWRAALRRRHSPALTEQRPPGNPPSGAGPAKILRFPQLFWVGGSLAAACVAVLVVLHPRIGRTVSGEPRLAEDASPYLKPERGGGTAPAAPSQAMTDGTRAAVEPAALHMPVGTSAYAANSTAIQANVAAPLLQQVRPSRALDFSRELAPRLGYSAGTLAVASNGTQGLVSLRTESAAANRGRAARRMWGTPLSDAPRSMDSASTVSTVQLRRVVGRRSTAAAGGPTYYYPPDDKFVVPVEPRLPPQFVVPPPPPPANGELWQTVPKPRPPWGAANGPSSFGYIEPAPRPFAFQLPQDWDNSIQKHPFLPHGPEPLVPPGPLDLLPGRRLEIRRFPLIRVHSQGADTDSYAYLHDNRFVAPADAPFSTFSVDVDTASYANVRRFIQQGRLPPPDAVRIEELVNYFPYHYPAPSASSAKAADAAAPFAASLEVADAPWAPAHRLVRIGLRARAVMPANRPAANLVFLLDVSGSMDRPNKLPLVKDAMGVLIHALRPNDRVAIVTYAGTTGLALASTPVSRSHEIFDALDALSAGGSTNGGMGLQLAYDIAKANFVQGGTNRVILCTDGDFNVGVTNQGDLVRLIEDKAKSGVMLTVLGFGMGNYKDSTLELLADKGNGNYGYIDTRSEATKLLRDRVDGTLNTVAKDVKVQVDFNPARVARYRLIGYEDRALNPQDFNDDSVDAGEIGAGHAVTALYEVVPVGAEKSSARAVDASRYVAAPTGRAAAGPHANELMTVKIRYKEPGADVSRKLEFPLLDGGGAFANASADFKFAAAVAEFGMILRHSPYRGTATMGDVIASAAAGSANPDDDPQGHRKQFVELALQAERLMPQERDQGLETKDQGPGTKDQGPKTEAK